MPLQLEITSENKDILGDDNVRIFREDGGTIGRALENDWILPDPERFISGRHTTVDHQAGAYYLADTSSNGVYINDEKEPLGKGNPRRLFDGDRLRMGSFEFLVKLDEGEGLTLPPPPPPSVVPDHIEQLVPEEVLRSSIMLLDEEEITGDDEFEAALSGVAINRSSSANDAYDTGASENPFIETKSTAEPRGQSAKELTEVFLKAAGINSADFHPLVDPVELMINAGQVLNELVSGISELLVCRTNQKSMFRLDQTTVLPRHNNPLKLSGSVTESIKQLLVGKDGDYLGPLDSVTEVCQDLKFHHDAVIGGMTETVRDLIDHFEPDELQDSFDRTLNKKPLFNALNQMKYWQLYCDLYPIMTQQGAGDLPMQFGEEFVRCYEKHISDYKRIERGDGGPLKATVMMAPHKNDDADQ